MVHYVHGKRFILYTTSITNICVRYIDNDEKCLLFSGSKPVTNIEDNFILHIATVHRLPVHWSTK